MTFLRKATFEDFISCLDGEKPPTDFGKYNHLVVKKVVDASGNSPLHRAVFSTNLLAIQWALALNADPNATDCNGQTPLMYAVSYNYNHPKCPDIIRLLLPHSTEKEVILSRVAKTGNPGLYLLVRGEGGTSPDQIFAKAVRDQVFGLLRSNGITIDELKTQFSVLAAERRQLELDLAYERELASATKAEITKHQQKNAELGDEMLERGEELAMTAADHHKAVTMLESEIAIHLAAIDEQRDHLQMSRSQKRKLELEKRGSSSAVASLSRSNSERKNQVAGLEKERARLDEQIEALLLVVEEKKSIAGAL